MVYRSRMDGTSDSLAVTVAASQHPPHSRGAEVPRTALEAFTASLHVTGFIAAVIFDGLAVLTHGPRCRCKRAVRKHVGYSWWSRPPPESTAPAV